MKSIPLFFLLFTLSIRLMAQPAPKNEERIHFKPYAKTLQEFITLTTQLNKLPDGKYVTYFPKSKQTAYLFEIHQTKLQGRWKSYYENGKLKNQGYFDKSYRDSTWVSFYSNGQKQEEALYRWGDIFVMKNRWDKEGKPQIINGNGSYHVINSSKKDTTQLTFENGRLTEQKILGQEEPVPVFGEKPKE